MFNLRDYLLIGMSLMIIFWLVRYQTGNQLSWTPENEEGEADWLSPEKTSVHCEEDGSV